MTNEKFKSEANTLKRFFEKYCNDKHQNKKNFSIELTYEGKLIKLELSLCETCKESITYSFDRLLQCPHEIKPRCRTCPAKCYDKKEWTKTAKIMKYSAIQFGLSKIKKRLFNLFK